MKTNLYKVRDYNIISKQGSLSPYVFTIRDLPTDEKPREKMLLKGAESLSVAELISVILITGTKKEEVLSMSRRILKEYGEKTLSGNLDPKNFQLN